MERLRHVEAVERGSSLVRININRVMKFCAVFTNGRRSPTAIQSASVRQNHGGISADGESSRTGGGRKPLLETHAICSSTSIAQTLRLTFSTATSFDLLRMHTVQVSLQFLNIPPLLENKIIIFTCN